MTRTIPNSKIVWLWKKKNLFLVAAINIAIAIFISRFFPETN